MRENNGELEFTDGDPTSQVELLVLGINFGKQKEREFWEAPESFQIHESYAKLLKEAINNYATKSFTMVHGIKIDEVQNDFQFVNVTFSPQQVIHLYGIFVELGRMIERKGE